MPSKYPSLPEEQKFAKWISGYKTGVSYNLTGNCFEGHYFMIQFDHVAITDEDIKNYILPLSVAQVELIQTDVTWAGVALLCDNPHIRYIYYHGWASSLDDQKEREAFKAKCLSRGRIVAGKYVEENAEKIGCTKRTHTTDS